MVQTPFMLGTNVTRIRTFPKQRCLTGTTTHFPRSFQESGFMDSDTFLCFGTSVTRIRTFPKQKMPYWHYYTFYKKVVSWIRTPLYALILMLLGFGLSQSKGVLLALLHIPYKCFMDSDTFVCFDTNVTRIRTFPKQRCLTGTTTHSIQMWFHGSDTFYAWY